METKSIEYISFLSIALGSIIIVIISFVLYYLMRQIKFLSAKRKDEKYDYKEMKAELDYMRRNIENQQYELSKKLESNINRWNDINHLVISSQQKSPDIDIIKEKTKPNEFLQSFNITDYEIDKRLVFVLIPFNDIYLNEFDVIKDICNGLGFLCLRGDEEFISGDILTHVVKNIVKARLIIANITGRNPNVLYELGIAHALNKPTIIISKNLSDAPFDIKTKYMILYKNIEDLKISLKDTLYKISLSNILA